MTPYDPEGLVLAVPAREVSAPTEAERLLLAMVREELDPCHPESDHQPCAFCDARSYLVRRGLIGDSR